jgi:hypothetical protein
MSGSRYTRAPCNGQCLSTELLSRGQIALLFTFIRACVHGCGVRFDVNPHGTTQQMWNALVSFDTRAIASHPPRWSLVSVLGQSRTRNRGLGHERRPFSAIPSRGSVSSLLPLVKHARIVVDGGKQDVVVSDRDGQTKCGARHRIDLELADKLARDSEFHDFAQLA